MNKTIKKRIEEINNGIVPEGYEKTSFGIFPCDWKITRIKSIAYLNKQKFNPQENKDNLVCIELEHIVPERGVLNGNTYAQNKHSLKNTFCKGDILFGKLRPYLGKYYHADQKGVCSTAIWVIRNHNTIDNHFLFQLVKGKRFIQSAQDSAFGTKMPRAEWQKVEKEKFVIPTSFREQSRIAEILMQWDKAIELQEKLIEAYQKSKKYYLNKMFPKKGSNVPEIRFPGFTAPWEQCKLGEVAIFRRGSFPQPYGKIEWYDGEESQPFVQVADVTDAMNLVDDTKQKISKLAQPMSVFAEKGSVLVTLQGSIGRVAITQYGAFVDRTVLIFEKYKTEINNLFWAYVIKQKFIEEARKAPGGTIKTITKEALSDFDLLLPNYNEQQQIGSFFEQLDNLITLHQQKRDKLLKQRKAMQQYLLTGIVRV